MRMSRLSMRCKSKHALVNIPQSVILKYFWLIANTGAEMRRIYLDN